ncbi:hypothetical protein [Subtercola sp. RTI3]|uniref:hypothetical protein n=1 Tax=Subtercola sp. RTI3 TaxID=3048639 RepID=UPI002B236615|nr:hypothetical protein [Subtercola sp. RTI3]MEA9986808.1 hypothetical protein [Subtercola sp. RTI3]
MSKATRIAKASAASAVLLGLVLAGANAAQADPSPAAFRTYAATGSDTIQSVLNGETNGYGTHAAVASSIASYDAFGSATIQTKSAGISYARPAGSGDGVKSLSASWNTGSHVYTDAAGNVITLSNNDVDIARSSSQPSTPVTAGATNDNLTFVPFARDAVSVAFQGSGITNFTTAQLTHVYNETTSVSDGVVVTGSGATATVKVNGVSVIPELPQASSGTRKFFQTAINVPNASLGAYVLGSTSNPSSLHENDATAANTAGDLIPFSAGQWISQKNGVSTSTFTGTNAATLKITNINSATAVTTSGTVLVPGTLYGSGSTVPSVGTGIFNRDTYLVAPTVHITTGGVGFDSTLKTLLTSTLPGAGAVSDFGFKPLTYSATTADWIHSAWTN